MALQALWSPEQQFQNTNGSILTNGKIYIQYRGRTALAEVFGDASGEHRRANPVILDANGRALCFADDSFSYTAVVCDFYGKELFSFDPIPCGGGSGSSQVTGAPSAHWLGKYGDTRVITSGQYSESLPLPSNPDYDGSFIESIQGNSNITLATGLYIIDAIVRFRQSPEDLQNLFGQVQVFTGWRDDETTWELRNETGPDSSQEDVHQFRVHLVRHVTGNGDKNFCIQVKTPVNWSWCQIQSLSILSLSSSSGGHGQYIPGDYIQITDDGTINVVGLQPSGNYANATSVAEAFYGVAQQMNALSGQINEVSGQIPSLDGYATEDWVNDQGFLKEVPSQYVTESELNSAVSGKADKSEIPSLSGYATEEWVRQQNYLTEVPSQYVTESELNSAISGKADRSDIPSLDGYATQQYVQSAVSGKQDNITFTYDSDDKITEIDGHEIAGTGGGGSTYTEGQYISIQNDIISVTGLQPSGDYLVQDDLNGYATDDDVQAAVSGKADVSAIPSLQGYATEQYVQNAVDGLASESYVQSQVSGKADKSEIPSLSGYATEEWVGQQGYLTSVPSEYITETELESELSGKADVSAIPSVAGLASETYVDQKVEEATSGKADVSAIPSLSGYATESWVSEQGYLTEVPSEYVTETELASELSGKADVSAIPSLQGYATEQWVGQQGYTTQSDIDAATSGKMDTSAVVNLSAGPGISITDGDGGVIIGTSGLQEQLTFGYDANDKINSINNSAIGAEASVVVDSATMQGDGSEEHPLGVRAEGLYVQEPLYYAQSGTSGYIGSDLNETVLFEGTYNTGTSSVALSESVDNFDSFKVLWDHFGTDINANKKWEEYSPDTKQCNCFIGRATSSGAFNMFVTYWGNNKTSLTKIFCGYSTCSNGAAGGNWSLVNEVIPIKVVGINRKRVTE